MMFAYVVMNQTGKEAIGSFLDKKQLPNSREFFVISEMEFYC